MKTTVINILNRKENSLFFNQYTPKHNLISHVICARNQTGQILNKEFRTSIENELNIVEKISKNGDKIAFCYKLDLMARQKQTN